MKKLNLISIVIAICFGLIKNSHSENYTKVKTFNKDGTLNAIIEIPVGTREKIEFDLKLKKFQAEVSQTKKRKINYLAYPTNYGFLPNTRIKKKIGGDGDAIDILVFGEKFQTGEIVQTHIIGMLKLLDAKQIDFKVIGVTKDIAKNTKSINDFNKKYPKALEIIETWFLNYKNIDDASFLESEGYVGRQETLDFIRFTSLK